MEALAASPAASAFFQTLSSVNRYANLFRIDNVKHAETRARKIAGFVEMLEHGIRCLKRLGTTGVSDS